jgi:hypothetical protein
MGTPANGITAANDAIASSKKLLSDINSSRTMQGPVHKTPAKPTAKPVAASSDYSHARVARSEGDSFMGVKADQGAELKAADANRDAAKKVLNQ